MNEYSLEEVTSARLEREFLDLPKRIYKNNPYWVCPLDNDIQGRFNPKVNELLQDGEAIRWIARNAQGAVVGRIAAFYNRGLVAASEGQPTGGCGFFECIDNQTVANLMFDACQQWLKARGIEAMDGPINFGDRDSWWGLLVKGFDDNPMYGCPYNPEYYITLFENYGFKNYFNQHTYYRELKAGLFPPNVYERVKRLKEEPAYRFEHLHKKRINSYVDDFMTIYNGAWAKFDGVKPIDREHTMALLETMKPIIDEKLMYFAYYNDQPIGFFLMVPDLNGIIEPFHGKFGWINKLRFLWRLKVTHKSDRIMGLIFGVVPEFQGKGIESGMIERFEQEVALGTLKRYPKGLELVWVGDFNPVMMRMVETLVNAKPYRMFTTYRYLFDRTKEFHRAPRMRVKKQTSAPSSSTASETKPVQ